MASDRVRGLVPVPLREELYRARRLGLRKYLHYASVKRTARTRTPPKATGPFDIGAPVPIVLDESTVHTVTSHWVKAAQAIKELRAFRKLAPMHACFVDIGAAEGIFSAAFC